MSPNIPEIATAPVPAAEPAARADRATMNRANAEHSTGPRTPEGKAKMRFNALQHGLYSETVVLPHENNSAYESMGEQFISRYHPQTSDERKLVQTLLDTQWRLDRIVGLESGILAVGTAQNLASTLETFGPLDDLTCATLAQSAGFLAHARTLDQLSRHEGRLRRLLQTTQRDLEALISVRPRGPRPEPVGSVPNAASEPDLPPSSVAAPLVPKPTQPRVPTPKFSGPMRKQHRKQWLREQAKKNAAPSSQE